MVKNTFKQLKKIKYAHVRFSIIYYNSYSPFYYICQAVFYKNNDTQFNHYVKLSAKNYAIISYTYEKLNSKVVYRYKLKFRRQHIRYDHSQNQMH